MFLSKLIVKTDETGTGAEIEMSLRHTYGNEKEMRPRVEIDTNETMTEKVIRPVLLLS